jgi:DNA-binding GntR family transcriptional regulator
MGFFDGVELSVSVFFVHKSTNTHKPDLHSLWTQMHNEGVDNIDDEQSELPLTERAYRALRLAIVRGDFEPGARLRVEELSRRLSVSSSPLREALNRLSEQGLVRALENRGFRVAPLTAAGVSDLARVRTLVECEALRDAIAHGKDAWEAQAVAAGHALALAERRLGDQPRSLDDDWSARHRAFHLSLYAACTSPMLLDLADVLFDNAERYRRWAARWRQAPRHKHNEHQQLLKAALSRESERAVELLRLHISRTEQLVCAALVSAGTAGLQ